MDKELTGLECDGLTRVISMILYHSNIPHRIHIGSIKSECGEIPHFWISLNDGFLIDYRAKMWMGDKPDVPHGIFKEYNGSTINYKGKSVIPDERSVFIGEILAESFQLEYQDIIEKIKGEQSARILRHLSD